MRIGFYTAFDRDPIHYVLGRNMIQSAKRVMPDVEITQLTDMKSAPVYGVDSIRRLPREPMCVHTARHYSLCEGDWLLIDTDIVIQRDVRHLFDGATWDFAVTDRKGTGPTFDIYGDYNIGVIFQRDGKKFWSAVVSGLLKCPVKEQTWLGNQTVANRLLKEGGWNYSVIPGYEFNYPPRTKDDTHEHASIVHFKGSKRKGWLYQQCASV